MIDLFEIWQICLESMPYMTSPEDHELRLLSHMCNTRGNCNGRFSPLTLDALRYR